MFSNVEVLKKPTGWNNIFMQEAALWSTRSHDTQTKCGCVLVKDKTVISTGYNGFIRDIDDSVLPTTRPDKYQFMIHAEANAVFNSVRLGRSTLSSTAYITAPPCLSCLQMLYQCGVIKIIFSDISKPKMCIYDQNYATILNMIDKSIEMYYLPKEFMDNTDIERYFEKNIKKSKEDVDKQR